MTRERRRNYSQDEPCLSKRSNTNHRSLADSTTSSKIQNAQPFSVKRFICLVSHQNYLGSHRRVSALKYQMKEVSTSSVYKVENAKEIGS